MATAVMVWEFEKNGWETDGWWSIATRFPRGINIGKLPLKDNQSPSPNLLRFQSPSQQHEWLPTDSSPKSTMAMPIPGDDPERDAETMAPTLIGISIGFVALSTTVVVLRLYTRYFVVYSPGPDDFTIAVAQVLSIGVSVATILRTSHCCPSPTTGL